MYRAAGHVTLTNLAEHTNTHKLAGFATTGMKSVASTLFGHVNILCCNFSERWRTFSIYDDIQLYHNPTVQSSV